MKSPYANPGDRAWCLAWCAADSIIDRASLRDRDVCRLATHALASALLPLASCAVASGRNEFDLVDEENEALDDFYRAWADDVVAATVAAI